jgi:sortase A
MAGVVCAGYFLFLATQSQVARHYASSLPAVDVPAQTRPGSVIGRMDIPALRVSVAVLEGDASNSLLRGVGHIPGTAELGGLGTVGLAGHRDTFLRPLRKVALGMEIRVVDGEGEYHYVIDSTEIVNPEAVEVIATHSRPELTLVTCYPFDFVGAAPKRFVVHAHLASVDPGVAAGGGG